MSNTAKLPNDFKWFQIRVFDVCPACEGSGKKPYHPLEECPICNGLKAVATVMYEGATLDILLARVFEDASKKKVNELVESGS